MKLTPQKLDTSLYQSISCMPLSKCLYMYMYMNNHMHSAPHNQRKKKAEKKEPHTIKQTKMHIKDWDHISACPGAIRALVVARDK